MQPHPMTGSPATDDDHAALQHSRNMVNACIQCGTCARVCPQRARQPHATTPRLGVPAKAARRKATAA